MIPDDITSIIQEIGRELKEENTPPQGRPIMTTQLPNYGQSRWASLQFTEKFAKGLIAQIPDVQFPRTHVLNKLFDLLPNAATIPNLSRLLDDVECSAEVRYGEITSTKEQAYTAHKSSINIVKLITDTL